MTPIPVKFGFNWNRDTILVLNQFKYFRLECQSEEILEGAVTKTRPLTTTVHSSVF